MSLYTNQAVKTHYLEPSLHNSSRGSEFRIKHKGKILPNLRLIDVGYQQTGATTASYNQLGGVKSMIKNIHLYDGKTSLSSLLEAPQYQAFKIFNQDVSKNKSLEQRLNQSNNVIVGANEETNGDIMTLFQDNRTQSQQALADTGKGWVDLRDYFPILKVLNHLDTENMFNNLRIVIEYELDSDLVVDRDDRSGTAVSPRLVVDVIEDGSNVAPNPEAVSWFEIESDTFNAAATAGAQTVNQRINGFSNKSVGRMVMVKKCSDLTSYIDTNAVLGVGALGSVAQQDEKLQFTVNGVQRFPRDGLNSKGNRGLAMLVDLWGDCSSFPFGSVPNIQNVGEAGSVVEDMLGQLSYIPYDNSGERIKSLEVNYKRTGNNNAGAPRYVNNKALEVRIYGEVSKTINMKGNSYNIVYN